MRFGRPHSLTPHQRQEAMQRTLPPWTSPSRPFNPSDYGDPYKAPGRNNYSGHGNAQRGNSHLVDGVENRCVIRTLGRTTCDTSGSPVTRLICDTKSWGHQCGLFVHDRPGEIDLPSHRRGGSGERYFKAFLQRNPQSVTRAGTRKSGPSSSIPAMSCKAVNETVATGQAHRC